MSMSRQIRRWFAPAAVVASAVACGEMPPVVDPLAEDHPLTAWALADLQSADPIGSCSTTFTNVEIEQGDYGSIKVEVPITVCPDRAADTIDHIRAAWSETSDPALALVLGESVAAGSDEWNRGVTALAWLCSRAGVSTVTELVSGAGARFPVTGDDGEIVAWALGELNAVRQSAGQQPLTLLQLERGTWAAEKNLTPSPTTSTTTSLGR